MNAHDVAVATITWVRAADEQELLVRSLARLAATGLRVAVADRGTSAAFTEELVGLAGFTVVVAGGNGLVPQVQQSMAVAASLGTRYILYVEPDKELFFDRLDAFIRRAPDDRRAGVVLAARSAESLQSFPPMQQYAEGVVNHLCGEMIGVSGDYSYGPFLMSRELLPHVRSIDARVGWGWRHSTFRAAHRQGRRVVHVIDDHPCPVDQRMEDDAERTHRLRQLSQNILGLID